MKFSKNDLWHLYISYFNYIHDNQFNRKLIYDKLIKERWFTIILNWINHKTLSIKKRTTMVDLTEYINYVQYNWENNNQQIQSLIINIPFPNVLQFDLHQFNYIFTLLFKFTFISNT